MLLINLFVSKCSNYSETPALWSKLTVTVNMRNQSVISEILSSRRMEAVSKIVIDVDVSLSEEGWMSLIRHQGLKELEVRDIDTSGVEPGLLARVVSSMKTVYVSQVFLTVEQISAILEAICDGSSLKVLDLSGNYEDMFAVEPDLMARAVIRLESVNVSYLSVEQISAILRAVYDESVLNLKILDLSQNYYMSFQEPRLLARAVIRLETVNLSLTELTREQISAILTAVSDGSALKVLDIS